MSTFISVQNPSLLMLMLSFRRSLPVSTDALMPNTEFQERTECQKMEKAGRLRESVRVSSLREALNKGNTKIADSEFI